MRRTPQEKEDIVEHLAQPDAPVPDDVAAALGLPVGSSYP
jgi:hypothetical protein